MKQFFLFCILFLAGMLFVGLYKHFVLLQLPAQLKTPLSNVIPFSLATPPKDSLTGSIVSFSAGTQWQAREATIPSELVEKIPVLQGQDFWTHNSTTLQITFPKTILVTMLPNSHISFLQTLPTHFVILQDSGSVIYAKKGHIPISIRVSPLLIQQDSGEMEIALDSENLRTILTVKKGVITVGFNDAENVSTVVRIEEGNTYTFDTEIREGEIHPIIE